jgi:multiple sugar transport system ATP-binding protein
MADVVLKNLRKEFEGGVVAVDSVNLSVEDGEFLVLVGPSGCGKSTMLRMMAGLESPTSGDIFIGGTRANDVPPKDRDVAMVFQNYALYPHMTVRENMAFGLKLRKLPEREIDEAVRAAAGILGLEDLFERKPRALSGGQRQRVALGRAIVRNPKVFLFDEPLSNLDAKLRAQMRTELNRLHRQLGVTMIYVTHDQVEAMTMGDRIAVLRSGELQQLGSPMELYSRPANRFVAGFIGTPSMNFVEGRVEKSLFEAEGLQMELDDQGLQSGPAVLGVRPEHVKLVEDTDATLVATVDVVEPTGSETLLYTDADGLGLVVRVVGGSYPSVGDRIGLRFTTDAVRFFSSDTGIALN